MPAMDMNLPCRKILISLISMTGTKNMDKESDMEKVSAQFSKTEKSNVDKLLELKTRMAGIRKGG